MKFKIRRNILFKTLSHIQGIVDKKNSLPILSNILLDAHSSRLTITATDLDLIFIHQLSNIEVLAISKGIKRDAGRENFYTKFSDSFRFNKDDPTLFFLQKLRDEVHRYAIAGHRIKSKKNIFKNPLDEINGIGANRKKSLLEEFGSAKAVGTASISDLLKVEGINKSTAQKIFNFFN